MWKRRDFFDIGEGDQERISICKRLEIVRNSPLNLTKEDKIRVWREMLNLPNTLPAVDYFLRFPVATTREALVFWMIKVSNKLNLKTRHFLHAALAILDYYLIRKCPKINTEYKLAVVCLYLAHKFQGYQENDFCYREKWLEAARLKMPEQEFLDMEQDVLHVIGFGIPRLTAFEWLEFFIGINETFQEDNFSEVQWDTENNAKMRVLLDLCIMKETLKCFPERVLAAAIFSLYADEFDVIYITRMSYCGLEDYRKYIEPLKEIVDDKFLGIKDMSIPCFPEFGYGTDQMSLEIERNSPVNLTEEDKIGIWSEILNLPDTLSAVDYFLKFPVATTREALVFWMIEVSNKLNVKTRHFFHAAVGIFDYYLIRKCPKIHMEYQLAVVCLYVAHKFRGYQENDFCYREKWLEAARLKMPEQEFLDMELDVLHVIGFEIPRLMAFEWLELFIEINETFQEENFSDAQWNTENNAKMRVLLDLCTMKETLRCFPERVLAAAIFSFYADEFDAINITGMSYCGLADYRKYIEPTKEIVDDKFLGIKCMSVPCCPEFRYRTDEMQMQNDYLEYFYNWHTENKCRSVMKHE